MYLHRNSEEILRQRTNQREVKEDVEAVKVMASYNNIQNVTKGLQSLITKLGLIVSDAVESPKFERDKTFLNIMDYLCDDILQDYSTKLYLKATQINANANLGKHSLDTNLDIDIDECIHQFNRLLNKLNNKLRTQQFNNCKIYTNNQKDYRQNRNNNKQSNYQQKNYNNQAKSQNVQKPAQSKTKEKTAFLFRYNQIINSQDPDILELIESFENQMNYLYSYDKMVEKIRYDYGFDYDTHSWSTFWGPDPKRILAVCQLAELSEQELNALIAKNRGGFEPTRTQNTKSSRNVSCYEDEEEDEDEDFLELYYESLDDEELEDFIDDCIDEIDEYYYDLEEKGLTTYDAVVKAVEKKVIKNKSLNFDTKKEVICAYFGYIMNQVRDEIEGTSINGKALFNFQSYCKIVEDCRKQKNESGLKKKFEGTWNLMANFIVNNDLF